jgi:hypothetical protein
VATLLSLAPTVTELMPAAMAGYNGYGNEHLNEAFSALFEPFKAGEILPGFHGLFFLYNELTVTF